MDTIHIHFLNATGKLTNVQPKVQSAFQAAREKAVELIDLRQVDVVVMDNSERTVADTGVGGYGLKNTVDLSLDTSKDIEEIEIYTTLLHEFHHCMRWRNPGYGDNLRDAIITEGMATLFEEEVANRTPDYAKADIAGVDIDMLVNELDNTDYDHHQWVILGDKELPRWLGYTLGYRIVRTYAKRHQTNAAELINTPTEKIFTTDVEEKLDKFVQQSFND